jgi:hypothetical protein
MEMIGQHNDGVDREGMTSACFAEGRAQDLDMVRQQGKPALRQIDGKEEAASRDEVATIICHHELAEKKVMGFARAQPILRAQQDLFTFS